MKRLCAVLAFAGLLLASAPDMNAQKFEPAEVQISKNKVEIDGKSYYVHQVTARQTLYSICKTYGADLEKVREINAGYLSGGLKTGSMLLIPVTDKADKAEQAQTTVRQEKSEKPEKAAIEQKSQAQTVKEEASPAVRKAEATGEDSDEGQAKYIRHRVKWYDSLLMLSLKYKVSQEDIIAFNNMDSRTLVVGQIIKIPLGDVPPEELDDNTIIDAGEDDEEYAANTDTGIPSLTISDEVLQEEEEEIEAVPAIVPFSGTAKMALMLPFSSGSSSPSANFLDFYAGVLMALEDLRKDGTNISLKVIDMADYASAEQMMAVTPADLDFVIGNFSQQSIEPAAQWCDKHHIPLISPLDQKVESSVYDHRYLVNAPLSSSTQAMRLAESMEYNPRRDNVVLVCENTDQAGQFCIDVMASLDSLNIPFTTVRAGVGRSAESIRPALVQGKRNLIVITTEKESLASDAVRNISSLVRGGNYEIETYASHRIRRFEAIDSDALKNCNARFAMGYYVDYNDDQVQDFVRRYRALYNSDPGNFSFQGYDITLYFGSALKRYGSDMINGIAHYPSQGLQLNFKFDRRNENGGMFNEATKNLAY